MEIAVLALGCFWGPEIKFSKIETELLKQKLDIVEEIVQPQHIKKFVQVIQIMLKLLN